MWFFLCARSGRVGLGFGVLKPSREVGWGKKRNPALCLTQGTRKQPVFPQHKTKRACFSEPKNKRGFLVLFSSAMVLLAAWASPGAAPCNTPPSPFSPPFNPKAVRGSWRGRKIKSCRPARRKLYHCWSKSATTRTCVKVVRLARWQDDDLSVTTHGVCKAAAPIARARAGNTRRCRPIAPSPVKKPRCRARDVLRTHSRLVRARI